MVTVGRVNIVLEELRLWDAERPAHHTPHRTPRTRNPRTSVIIRSINEQGRAESGPWPSNLLMINEDASDVGCGALDDGSSEAPQHAAG